MSKSKSKIHTLTVRLMNLILCIDPRGVCSAPLQMWIGKSRFKWYVLIGESFCRAKETKASKLQRLSIHTRCRQEVSRR